MKLHCCVAAYISDYAFLRTALLPHQHRSRVKFMVSLDHTMWFHAPFRTDQWMLYECESPWAGKPLCSLRGGWAGRAGETPKQLLHPPPPLHRWQPGLGARPPVAQRWRVGGQLCPGRSNPRAGRAAGLQQAVALFIFPHRLFSPKGSPPSLLHWLSLRWVTVAYKDPRNPWRWHLQMEALAAPHFPWAY